MSYHLVPPPASPTRRKDDERERDTELQSWTHCANGEPNWAFSVMEDAASRTVFDNRIRPFTGRIPKD